MTREELFNKWKEKVSQAQIDKCNEILTVFEMDIYPNTLI